MGAYEVSVCPVERVRRLNENTLDVTVQAPELAAACRPGQFAQIFVPGHTLRRPISICEAEQAAGTVRFVFQIRGEGTRRMAEVRPGESWDLLGPLGQGFPVEKGKRTLLLGGGIGTPPLLGVAKALGQDAVAALGFRSAGMTILEEDFQRTGAKVLVATDDGSLGFHGTAVQAAAAEEFDVIFACGPLPMLKAAKALARERSVPCFLSLEERMACGIGACLGCAVPLLDDRGQEHFGHVCKDGPVFDSRRLTL